MDCDFEELQFRDLVTGELARTGSMLFPVGQVFEASIGIDQAYFTLDPRLWALFPASTPASGPPSPWPGVFLDPTYWNLMTGALTAGQIPRFKCNLFLQYKRPEHMIRSNASEYGSWNQKYFRYDISELQHEILVRLESTIGNNALVLYCSAPPSQVMMSCGATRWREP